MDTTKFANERGTVRGEYVALSLSPTIQKGHAVLDDIRVALRSGNDAVINTLKHLGIITDVRKAHNLIPTSGRTVLARILCGDTTYSGEVDWGALGSDATPAFTNASTELGSEVYRCQAASQAFDENIAYIDWFIASGDVADQTFEEFGAFIDGTVTADSGQAWSLLKTGGWQKNGSMFISAKYTLLEGE